MTQKHILSNKIKLRRTHYPQTRKKISEKIQYSYEVDAVTTATITTALMYNSIKRLTPLVKQVKQLKVFTK